MEKANAATAARLQSEVKKARAAVLLAEMRRRDLARATARYDAACDERKRLVLATTMQRRVYGDRVSPVSEVAHTARPGDDPVAVDAAARLIEVLNTEGAARLESEVRDARVAEVAAPMTGATQNVDAVAVRRRHGDQLESMRNVPKDPLSSATNRRPADAGMRDSVDDLDEWRPDVVDTVCRVLSRLAAEVDDDAQERLSIVATNVLAAPTRLRANALLGDLRDRCNKANVRAHHLRKVEEETRRLTAILFGLDGDEPADLRRRMQHPASIRVEDLSALKGEVATVVERSRLAADQHFAATKMTEVLIEMGLEVAEGFTTILQSAKPAYARDPKWGGYAVRLRLHGDDNVSFRLVRPAGANRDPIRDVQVERSFCKAYDRIDDAVAARGVQLTTERGRVVAPGASEVLSVPDSDLPAEWTHPNDEDEPEKELRS